MKKFLLIALILVISQADPFSVETNLMCNVGDGEIDTREYTSSEITDTQLATLTKLGETFDETDGASILIYTEDKVSGNDNFWWKLINSNLEVGSIPYTVSDGSSITFETTFEDIIVFKQTPSVGAWHYTFAYLNRQVPTDPVIQQTTMAQVTDMKFSKIIERTADKVSLIFVGDQDKAAKTQLVILQLTGALGQLPQEVRPVSSDSNLDIIGGNSDLFYAGEYYYTWDGSEYKVDTNERRIDATPGFGSIIYAAPSFIPLDQGHFILTTQKKVDDKYHSSFGWYKGRVTVVRESNDQTSTDKPRYFWNKRNFIYLTENRMVYIKYDNNGVSNDIFELITDSADKTDIRGQLESALKVSFNTDKVFILTATQIIIYEHQTNSVTGAVVSFDRLQQIQLSSDVATVLDGEAGAKTLGLSISCSCQTVKLTTFVCFSTTLKCMASVSSVKDTCTTDYVDSVNTY